MSSWDTKQPPELAWLYDRQHYDHFMEHKKAIQHERQEQTRSLDDDSRVSLHTVKPQPLSVVLSLPRELCDMIWSQILQERYTEVYPNGRPLPSYTRIEPKADKTSDRLTILQVSKQVHSEAARVLDLEGEFNFYMNRRISKSALQYIVATCLIQCVAITTEFQSHQRRRFCRYFHHDFRGRRWDVTIRGGIGHDHKFPRSMLGLLGFVAKFRFVSIRLCMMYDIVRPLGDLAEIGSAELMREGAGQSPSGKMLCDTRDDWLERRAEIFAWIAKKAKALMGKSALEYINGSQCLVFDGDHATYTKDLESSKARTVEHEEQD